MERFEGKIAVVTGASTGIGEAISRKLISRGISVVGLARNIEKLQALSRELSATANNECRFYGRKCDVTVEKEIRDTFSHIKANIGPVSILVNNAGVIQRNDTEILNVKQDDFDITFDTNVKGLLLCTQEAINSMNENNTNGHIININSIAGFSDYEDNKYAVYAASKHAARVLAKAARRQMSRKKSLIKISNISPGEVKTNMQEKVGVEINEKEKILSAEDVAAACISLLDTPPKVLIPELTIIAIHEDFY